MCEIFGPAGYIRTRYDYTSYGQVTATGDVTQPIQWSSEFNDEELSLVYYNYRHYNPEAGRWINRDPIAEEGGLNLYGFAGNSYLPDYLGFARVETLEKIIEEKRTVFHYETAEYVGVFRERLSDPEGYMYSIQYTNYIQRYKVKLLVEIKEPAVNKWDITRCISTILGICKGTKAAYAISAGLNYLFDYCEENENKDDYNVIQEIERHKVGMEQKIGTYKMLKVLPNKIK